MLRSPNPTRRIAGRLLVVTAVVVALPLTAGRAVHYVDVPAAPRPVAAPRVTAAVTPLASAAVIVAQPVRAARAAAAEPVLAAAVTAPPRVRLGDDSLTINDDLVTIDGVTKRYEDLTPAEKARVRIAIAGARASLEKTHIDQAQLMRDVASIPDQTRIAEIRASLAHTQASLAESVRRIDERAARDRAAGRAPDPLDVAIRARLQAAQQVDLQTAVNTLATVNQAKIAESVANAAQSMEAARVNLARIQARIDADPHH